MKSIIQERNHAPIHAKQEKMREEAKVDAKKNKKKIEEVCSNELMSGVFQLRLYFWTDLYLFDHND